ncbi:SIMPL domain-containing protein [Halorussus sp. MSC15.2]|uniref:SIMPL domain-containing protein n=1 Tax=Halorussus sp. MSC15.2 TaxID=2283638 RepID=UPI0013D72904|nr:SIMPL domain-containing protein [Halorussus sp. MSC15.2]NEU58911.1 SIMPL domain-containing protein [Halorussus sp. MSC15.2]
MHKGVLATVGVALLLVTAGCVGSVAPTADASAQTQQPDRGGKTIGVSATGQAAATPDQAVVRVAVVASDDDANVVRERLAENVTRMREALKRAGVADDQIRTVAYNIEQEYREEGGERRPAGFRGVHAFEITLSNTSRAGAIIDAAVSNGADRVDSVELTLSEERRREVRAEALRDAMDSARANADVIAESANLTVTGVHSASTGDVSYSPVRAESLSANAAGQSGTQIESGPVTVVAQVQVTYNATGA